MSEALIESLRSFCLLLQLTTPECFNSLIVERNLLTDTDCLKSTLAKCLGVGIVLGSILVKLPQIIKILRSGSAKGLSFTGVLLELVAVTANGAYSYSKGFPFGSYGEAVFMSLQTSLIALLILWFTGNTTLTLLFSAVYGAVVFAITHPAGWISAEVLWYGQAANIPMIVVGKLIQAISNFRQGHTGQLSAITVFLLTAGSLARIFTSIQETAGDPVVVATYVASSFVNVLLTFQVIYYWNTTNKVLAGEKKTEKKRKRN